jgi:hypothetical protein
MKSNETLGKDYVISMENRLLVAIQHSDAATLDLLLHPDLLFHAPNGQIITKETDLHAHRSGNMVVDSIAASEMQVNIIGDNAVVSLVIETSGAIFKQPIQGRFRYIRVWKLFNGQLKVIAGSCILI